MKALAATLAIVLTAVSMVVPPALARHSHRDRSGDAVPGQFDYYLLSLSWSPAFCLQQPTSAECRGPRRFGFIVHGLWPQNERGWPENCGGDPWVPEPVAVGISDLMPARKLVFHEWQTHGTCSGLDPAAFFKLVRSTYTSIRIPSPLRAPADATEQSPASIVEAFRRANEQLPADAVVVTCSGQGVPRLREVHICFDRELRPRMCSADALREGCRASALIVPPLR